MVITGIGPVTAAGTGVDALVRGLRDARSPIATVRRFDPAPFRSRMAAEVRDFEPHDFMSDRIARRTDRFVQFALAGTVLALRDAGLMDPSARIDDEGWGDRPRPGRGAAGSREASPTGPGSSAGADSSAVTATQSAIVLDLDPDRTAVQLGSAMGGIAHAETQLRAYLERGARALDPRLATTTFAGAASCQVAVHFGITGPNSTNAMSCAAGTMAIGEGARLVRDGAVDTAIVGGVDAPLAPVCYGAFASLRAMSQRNDAPEISCRPFDADRDGFVMGEGAGILILEERDRALARGARIYAEVSGYGTNNDAHHMAAPRPDGSGAARAIEAALRQAGVATDEVDHVNAHGSSTVLNDRTESTALRLALGDHASAVSVTGTKPFHGHALGASGAIETAITALSMHCAWVPPTLNLEQPGEGCDLDYVTGRGRDGTIGASLTNSFGFGGINAVLLLTSAGFRS